MSAPILFTIYPDECDAFGHLNQASYLALFERARWEVLARGPGMDAFPAAGVWPAVRRATLDFHTGAWPGDQLRFSVEVLHRGRTSFTLKQSAVRTRDERLVATAEIVFVCIDDQERPVPVPENILAALGMEPKRITLSNGVTIALEDIGRSGVPVLFIHGFPLDREIWTPQLIALRGHRLIAPDLRGFGMSDSPDTPATMSTYADDMIALLDALKVDKVVVCGLSMGGYIAFDLVKRYRHRVAGLVIMDARATADTPAGKEGRDKMIATARSEGSGSIAQTMSEKFFATATAAPLRDSVTARMRQVAVSGIVAALGAMRDRADSTALLPTLAGLPTLVIVGKEDRLTPSADVGQVAEGIPGATFVEIPNAGHLPTLEQPETVNAALQEFLDRIK